MRVITVRIRRKRKRMGRRGFIVLIVLLRRDFILMRRSIMRRERRWRWGNLGRGREMLKVKLKRLIFI